MASLFRCVMFLHDTQRQVTTKAEYINISRAIKLKLDNMEEMDEVLLAGETVVNRRKQSRKRGHNEVNITLDVFNNTTSILLIITVKRVII